MNALASPPKCPSIPGSETILKPGARIIFGEVHGTTETPKFVADMACLVAQLGPVRVGLELSIDEQPRLDRFVGSVGGATDRKDLLAGSHWTSDTQDGRSSTALLALIESVRALKHDGADIAALAFDVSSKVPSDRDRDQLMARALAAAFAKDSKATFLILVGNLHARKARHEEIDQLFMAQELVAMKVPVTTLDVNYGAGTTWACITGEPGPHPPDRAPTWICGVHAIGKGPAPPIGITMTPSKDRAFDGTYSIGEPTFSPPASREMTKEEQKRVDAAKREAEANRAGSRKGGRL